MREKYLDGLRGWAALCVVLCHAGPNFFGIDPRFGGFLPFAIDGTFAVYVFFALSGYVLSVEFFRTGSRRPIASQAIRRYPRLTIPIVAIVLMANLFSSADLYYNQRAAAMLQNVWLDSFYRYQVSLSQSLDFATSGVYLLPEATAYNAALWSMFYEMLGSMVLFAVLLLAGRSTAFRFVGHAGFIGLAWVMDSPVMAIAMGAALANAVQHPWHQRLAQSRWGVRTIYGLLFIALIAVATRSAPTHEHRRLMALCSVVIVYATDRRLHRGEEDRIIQALSGKQREDRERGLMLTGGNALLTMFNVIVYSGLRLREAYTLRRGQIDLDAKVMRVQSSKQWRGKVVFREVPIRPEVHRALTAYLSTRALLPAAYLFPFMDEEPNMTLKKVTQRLSDRFRIAFQYAGCDDLREHDLRHEATCRWLEMRDSTGNWMFRLEEVNRIMGWSANSTMAQRYASFRGSDLADRMWATAAPESATPARAGGAV